MTIHLTVIGQGCHVCYPTLLAELAKEPGLEGWALIALADAGEPVGACPFFQHLFVWNLFTQRVLEHFVNRYQGIDLLELKQVD